MDSTGDSTGQHREGIDHIASHTAPPAERTGAENGGAISHEHEKFVSPLVPREGNTGSQGGLLSTAKGYLGMGGAGTTGTTGVSETGQSRTAGETRNVEDQTVGSSGGAPLAGEPLGTGNTAVGEGLESTTRAGVGHDSTTTSDSALSGVSGDPAMGRTGSAVPGVGNDTVGPVSSTTGTGSTVEAAKEKVEDATNTNTSSEEKPVTSGTDEHKPPKPADGKPHKLENESSIPTAGGERLGEKHWGESKIVPDDPTKRASAAGISSEAGQSDKQTSDNTAKNTGGATGPPDENHGSGTGEEKPKMTDKIKGALHMGGK